jgi:hypothetical protein
MDIKTCCICKKDLPATSEFFAQRKDRKNRTLQSSCRVCHKEYRKIHYQKNKKKYIKKAKEYNKKVANWYDDFKSNLICSKCDEKRWWVLDFHHADPDQKEYSIAKLKNNGSKPKLLKEISKCIILCSNCHRDLHYKQDRC